MKEDRIVCLACRTVAHGGGAARRGAARRGAAAVIQSRQMDYAGQAKNSTQQQH